MTLEGALALSLTQVRNHYGGHGVPLRAQGNWWACLACSIDSEGRKGGDKKKVKKDLISVFLRLR